MNYNRIVGLTTLTVVGLVGCWAQESAPAASTAASNVPESAPVPTAASNLPDISIIGDSQGWFNKNGTLGNTPSPQNNTNNFELNELEMVIGGKIHPNIAGTAVISLPAPNFTPGLEEGYATFNQITSSLPVGARVGVVRLPFGKMNPVHSHQLPYVDTPMVVQDLLGDFRGNGAELVSLIPTHSSLFVQAQVGRWTSQADPTTPDGAAGFSNDTPLTLGRLWTGGDLSANSDIQLGFSDATGEGVTPTGGGATPNITVLGTDVTYRQWMSRGRRLMVQGEAIKHQEDQLGSGAGTQDRSGYYLMTTYRPDATEHEYGIRYDRSDTTASTLTHESGVSVFGTHFLNEMTFLRFEATHGEDPTGKAVNTVGTQIVFGFGPHTHPFQ